MIYRALNLVIQHALAVTAVLLLALITSTGFAMANYAKQQSALDRLAELREEQDGCPDGMWRVGQTQGGGRFCIDPVKWGELQGAERGVRMTFAAIRKGETPCPVSEKSRKRS